MSSPVPVVAIDGPSGSGKGTIAARLAQALGWHLLDSGALYRIVAACALSRGIPLDDEASLARMATALEIRFEEERVLVDGTDVTETIRTEPVSAAASEVAALGAVRAAILDLQRSMRAPPGLVADGRDMGTVVFPDAPLKVYLDASAQVRAERRYKQLKNKGLSVSFRALLANLVERDARDRERAVSPLVPAQDALIIDSTDLGIEEVLNQVLTEVRDRHLN
ncbi:MAG: (d)CMP kinase [Pseudomonadales bacterium]|jgi:cytidylate kinase